MNEYYLHDKENGQPQLAAQLWRDAHTEDQLAERIRAHLMRDRATPLAAVYTVPFLELVP